MAASFGDAGLSRQAVGILRFRSVTIVQPDTAMNMPHSLLSLQIEGFHNRQMRPLLAQMLGLEQGRITQGRMTYDLRRLRLHGLIERIEKTHRYRLTRKVLGVAFIYRRTYLRLLRPALSAINEGAAPGSASEARMLQQIQSAIDNFISSQAA